MEAPIGVSRRWTEEEEQRLRELIEAWTDKGVAPAWDYVIDGYNRSWHTPRSAASIRSHWSALERRREEAERRQQAEDARKPKPPRQPPEAMWLVMRCQPVESIRGIALWGSWGATADQEPFWFLPVFESREEAEKWAEDGKYQIIPVAPGKAT